MSGLKAWVEHELVERIKIHGEDDDAVRAMAAVLRRIDMEDPAQTKMTDESKAPDRVRLGPFTNWALPTSFQQDEEQEVEAEANSYGLRFDKTWGPFKIFVTGEDGRIEAQYDQSMKTGVWVLRGEPAIMPRQIDHCLLSEFATNLARRGLMCKVFSDSRRGMYEMGVYARDDDDFALSSYELDKNAMAWVLRGRDRPMPKVTNPEVMMDAPFHFTVDYRLGELPSEVATVSELSKAVEHRRINGKSLHVVERGDSDVETGAMLNEVLELTTDRVEAVYDRDYERKVWVLRLESRPATSVAVPEKETTESPFESIENAVAFDPRDWSVDRRDAWIYGIVLGWDTGSMAEVSKRHGWSLGAVRRLHRLHDRWKVAREQHEVVRP